MNRRRAGAERDNSVLAGGLKAPSRRPVDLGPFGRYRLQFDLADLDHGLEVRVVRDIGHNCLGVR